MSAYRRLWLTLSLIITLVSLASGIEPLTPATVRAQTGGASLVFLKDGDLWKWDGSAVTRLTTWGYNQRPVLAPDGWRVAYNSWAQITVTAIAQGWPAFGVIPSNIWVLDVNTGNAFRVADQPPNATFAPDTQTFGAVVMRGTPAWSPDGNQLAWAELASPEFIFRLVVYDFTTGATNVIVTQLPYPFADGGFVPVHDVIWGNRGIAVFNVAINETTYDFEERALLYDPNGAFIHDTLIGSSATEWAVTRAWVRHLGQEHLGVVYPSGRRFLIDPATGDQQDMPALPELYSVNASNNSATTFLSASVDASQNVSHTWTAVFASRQQDQPLNFTGDPKNIAVSADGQAIAYSSDAVYVWQNGSLTRVPGTEGIASPWDVALVWGVNAWRVRTDWPGGGGLACSPAPRLTIGSLGQVTPGLPNVIRALPRRGPDSAILGEIPAGGVFTVLSGPQCDSEGHYWWQVNYQNITGWTAEGEGVTYWLKPHSEITPGPVACTLAPRLTPGSTAYVLPGVANVIRALPRRGPDSQIIGRIPANGVFTVLSGPQCDSEGRYWWQVNYQGIVGWTAEGESSAYWVAPFGCPASPLPRLAPGMLAQVTPGLPNRLRAGPGTNYDTVAEIPGSGVFTVLSGPQCGPEGWSYWRVQYGNTVGWTAEGDGATYWLQPATYTPPPPPPTPTPIPAACSLAPRLTPGTSAFVIPGPANVIRSAPGIASNSAVIGQIPGGAFFYIVGGPQCGNDGRHWWQILYQGVNGWTAEGEGADYWVSPFVCSNSPRTRLVVGGTGRVIPGPANVLRSAPGTGSNSVVIGQIPGGSGFSVISGPQCGNDGRAWWQVNYAGAVGWTAEGEGGTYWVEPILN
jgi:hypothetical protein